MKVGRVVVDRVEAPPAVMAALRATFVDDLDLDWDDETAACIEDVRTAVAARDRVAVVEAVDRLAQAPLRSPKVDFVIRARENLRRDPDAMVAMARRGAVTVSQRRTMWARRYAQQQEARARTLCEASPSRVCVNESACGFGECAFASDLAREVDVACTGQRERPVTGPGYDLDQIVEALAA